jgi:hypothetical protein
MRPSHISIAFDGASGSRSSLIPTTVRNRRGTRGAEEHLILSDPLSAAFYITHSAPSPAAFLVRCVDRLLQASELLNKSGTSSRLRVDQLPRVPEATTETVTGAA